MSEYLSGEWKDFIAAQLAPFGALPVYLGIGNHETIAPKTRAEYLSRFAAWLGTPALRAQRLADDPNDRRPRTYYRWRRGGADFVSLDNATPDQFDAAQLAWFERALERDAADPSVRLLVVGMHEALPNSAACGHSMNDSPVGTASGRRVYRDLLRWRRKTGKMVAVLASHSHYVMQDIYDTPYWRNAEEPERGVLPGWIVGTAGAMRYPLPSVAPSGVFAKTRVYGYLLGEVSPDGAVSFRFREISREDVPEEVVAKYGRAAVDACFSGNADMGPSRFPPNKSCSEE